MTRYNKDSKYQTIQRRMGANPGHPTPWSNELIDCLLNLFLRGDAYKTIMSEMYWTLLVEMKTVKAIDTFLSKLKKPEKYITIHYVPGPSREIRTGPWNERELDMLSDIRHWPLEKIVSFLGRSQEDVLGKLQKKKGLW